MAVIKKIFPVKGMHCASCVNVLERALKKVDGVTDVSVNLATNKAAISYSDDTSEQVLASVVEKKGYALVLEDSKKSMHEHMEDEAKLDRKSTRLNSSH